MAFKTIVDPRVVHWSATAGVKLAGVHYEAFGVEIEDCSEECLWQTKIEQLMREFIFCFQDAQEWVWK